MNFHFIKENKMFRKKKIFDENSLMIFFNETLKKFLLKKIIKELSNIFFFQNILFSLMK